MRAYDVIIIMWLLLVRLYSYSYNMYTVYGICSGLDSVAQVSIHIRAYIYAADAVRTR